MFGRGLKSIDFYKNVPDEYKEGTIAGGCISIVSISCLIILSLSAISTYMSPTIVSDLIIDQKHVEDRLRVNIDIEFPNIPCAMLSLDVQNKLRVHHVNIKQQVKKISLSNNQQYHDEEINYGQKVDRIREQLKNKDGCRMMGYFQIDRVPGNFHFSNHGYSQQTMTAMSPHLPKLDFTHKINYLYFGEQKPEQEIQNSLGKFISEKEISDGFFGISYIYFLEIVSKNIINSNGYHRQTFFYTARINEILLGTIPMVHFKYETNPMTQLQIGQYMNFHSFIIQLVAITGGIYTVASIIDKMIHSSIHYLIKKHEMGKLM